MALAVNIMEGYDLIVTKYVMNVMHAVEDKGGIVSAIHFIEGSRRDFTTSISLGRCMECFSYMGR